MKRNLLTIILFSILAIFSGNNFAQDSQPDCKYILDFDKCRNILFALNTKGVVANFGGTTPQSFSTHSKYIYKGVLLEILNTDLVETVEFWGFESDDYKLKSPYSDRIPDQNISWGAGKDKIIKKFGNPPNFQKMRGVDGQKVDFLFYDDRHLNFTFENGKLVKIEMKRKVSDEEHARMIQKSREEEAKKSPQEKAREEAEAIISAYKRTHAQIEEYSDKIKFYNSEAEKWLGKDLKSYNRNAEKAQNYSRLAVDSIDRFLKQYEGLIPKELKAHLLEDREKLSGGKLPE